MGDLPLYPYNRGTCDYILENTTFINGFEIILPLI